jgi:hypothetical protein
VPDADAPPEDPRATQDPSAGHGEPPSKAPLIVLAAFGVVGVGALGIYFALQPDGEPVGELDLLDSTSTVVVEGAAGDDLTFVSRVTTSLASYRGGSWKSRSNDATRAMKASTLTVVVVGPDGSEQTARCPLWGGSMSSDRPDDEHLTENGVINDCTVDLTSAGRHTISARVDWDPTLIVTAARLTTYRAPPP